MSQTFKKHKPNSTNDSTLQKRDQHPAENTPGLQSTPTSTFVQTPSVVPPNVVPGAPNPQMQGQQSTYQTSATLSRLTGISIPPSCAESPDIIPNGAMLPLFVEYAHVLFQQSVHRFGKVFALMTQAMQQEMIRKTEEEGIRGFAEQVAKYAIWQIISFAELNQGDSVFFQEAVFTINKAHKNPYEDDEVRSEEDYVIETSKIQIGLPPQFARSCHGAFTAMVGAVNNCRPFGKIQCCQCRGWGHNWTKCVTQDSKEHLDIRQMAKWESSKSQITLHALKFYKFQELRKAFTAETSSLLGSAYIGADGHIHAKWVTPYLPLKLDFDFLGIKSQHFFENPLLYAEGRMYATAVPRHLRYEDNTVSTRLRPNVRVPLIIMNIRREVRKL